MTRPGLPAWGDPHTLFQAESQVPVGRPGEAACDAVRLWACADGHLGFFGWLCAAQARSMATDGIGLLDLSARDWRDMYDGRVPPEEAADVAVDEFVSAHGLPRP